VRARAHGARLLQVPGRVLQGLDPVPGGGGKSERVGERGAEEKTHLRGEKKLRGHFLSFPPGRTGRRSSDEYLKWNSFSPRWIVTVNIASMWACPTRLLSQVAVLLLLIIALTTDRGTASPQPGHLVHDFYKCSSKFYYDFHRCKLEREEAARRGLNRRSRQIHHNSATKAGQASSLVFVAVFAAISTQKCHW